MDDAPTSIKAAQTVANPLPQNLRLFTHSVRITAAVACAAAIGLSLYYFAGFAENDQRTAHLLNAFAICFGVGGLFYLPAYYTAKCAHKALTIGHSPGLGFGIYFLMPPWIIVGFFLQASEGLLSVIGAVMSFLALQYIAWAFSLLKMKT